MVTGTWRRPALGGLCAALALLAVLAGQPAASATRSPHVAGRSGSTLVTVMLQAPHPAELRRQGAARHLDRRQRVRRLHRLLPARATRLQVARRLRHLGLRVVDQSLWSVTAKGTTSQVRRLATHPSDLGTGVAAAVPDTGPLLRPMATTGQDYRDAYAPPNATRDSGTDPRVADTTVATIQFAQFDAGDLTSYAVSLGLPDPVASGQYQTVVVGTGPADASGTEEVALDQEAILATAPLARQRAYFARNSFDGFVNAFSAVLQDAVAQHITALSVSWGGCESDFGTGTAQMERVLQSFDAAGVTVFNASGDTGIYCNHFASGLSTDVSYPASSPNVVAVGGTSLRSVAGTWTETAWSCSTFAACTSPRAGGSGGGASARFSQPLWQRTYLSGAYRNAGARLVPDISAVADPGTGLDVAHCGERPTYGGTSLAAPVTAALFDEALARAGFSKGVGSIGDALYRVAGSAATYGTDFRDMSVGSNGAAADATGTHNPSVNGAAGYDTVTGLGSVLWPAFVHDAFVAPRVAGAPLPAPSTPTTWSVCSRPSTAQPDTQPVTQAPGFAPTARARLLVRPARRGRLTVQASWSTVLRSAVAWSSTRVTIADATTGRVVVRRTGFSGRVRLRAPRGHLLRMTVTAVDVSGRSTTTTVGRRVR